jgi:protein SCO1/2
MMIMSSLTRRRFSTTNSKSPISWRYLAVAMGLGTVATGGFVYLKQHATENAMKKRTLEVGKPLLGGPFTLVDHNGIPRTDASLIHGKTFGLLYFGFTHCPDICPSELVKMTNAISTLDAAKGEEFRERVLPIFITVDPTRDGVAQVKHYVKDFHPRMVGLTGAPQQIAEACRAFRVYHSVNDASRQGDEDYLVDHSIVMYLIKPNGEFVDFYTQLATEEEIVARVKNRIREYDHAGINT